MKAQSKVVGANVLFSEMDQVEARLESAIDDNIQKSEALESKYRNNQQ